LEENKTQKYRNSLKTVRREIMPIPIISHKEWTMSLLREERSEYKINI
jgi:hypothetical protein